MIDYSIDLDAGPVVRKLKRIGADMGEINRRILGLLSEAVVTKTPDYLRGPRPELLGVVTGKLMQSITYKVYSDYAIVGTNLPYAAIHEYGGAIPGGRMPARPYVKPSMSDLFESGRAQLIADREMQRQLDRRMP